MKRWLKLIIFTFLILIILILILFVLRFFNPREIDDVTISIPCSENLIKKSDILYVIPKYNNNPISENRSFCNYILSFNKTLAMHGIKHNFKEFSHDKSQTEIEEGIKIFEECFNQTPSTFKAPQIFISKNNKLLIKNNKMKLKSILNQITHKVYHCQDTGSLPNWFNEWF